MDMDCSAFEKVGVHQWSLPKPCVKSWLDLRCIWLAAPQSRVFEAAHACAVQLTPGWPGIIPEISGLRQP